MVLSSLLVYVNLKEEIKVFETSKGIIYFIESALVHILTTISIFLKKPCLYEFFSANEWGPKCWEFRTKNTNYNNQFKDDDVPQPPPFSHTDGVVFERTVGSCFFIFTTYLHTLVGMAPNVAYIACTCECIKVTKRNFVCCCSSCCNCMPQYITFSIAMCPIIPHYLDANDSISSFKYGCQWSQCFVARRY